MMKNTWPDKTITIANIFPTSEILWLPAYDNINVAGYRILFK